jgi:uncharacterized protein YkwD
MDRRRQDPVPIVLVATLLGPLLACAAITPSPTRPEVTRVVAPPGPAAISYSSILPSGAAISDDAEHTLSESIRNAQARRRVQLLGDPRLLALSQWVADQVDPNAPLPMQAALDQAASHLGLLEPTPHIIVSASDNLDEARARLVADLDALLSEHDYSHYGAVAQLRDGLHVFVVTLVFRFVELAAPVPRQVERGSAIMIEGQLTHDFSAPELAITNPDGQVVRRPAGPNPAFRFELLAAHRGVYEVELLGQGPRGIAVVANFPVYVDESPPGAIELLAPEPVVRDPEAAARRLLELLNAERARVSLPSLISDRALAQIAAAHDRDMLEHGFVGHTSPTSGSASDRITRAGIRTGLILENIGRGYSLSEVHGGLMQSPGHRANLLNASATNVGIAVAISQDAGHPVYLATELFTRVTPALPADGEDQLLRAIDAARASRGRSALRRDGALTQIAKHAAVSCFARPTDGDPPALQSVHDDLARQPSAARVDALLSLASSLADLSELPALLDPGVVGIGAALTQGSRPDIPPNTLCAVLLLARAP